MNVDLDEVEKVFPYGKLLPIEVVVGGLSFNTGRVVRELGDRDDLAVCVAAAVRQCQSGMTAGNVTKEVGHTSYTTQKMESNVVNEWRCRYLFTSLTSLRRYPFKMINKLTSLRTRSYVLFRC